jgi:threonine dehydratase
MRPISLQNIRDAQSRIDPVFLASPLLENTPLDAALGCQVLVKDETRNPVGSFKGRGTDLFAATSLGADEAIVCASAGNFGQGLARAAVRRGHRCVVFAATSANPVKVEAMRRFGAEVRLVGADFDAAKEAAREYAVETGARFVEDGAEPVIAEGAGTLGLELLSGSTQGQMDRRHGVHLDAVLVPLGDGALLAGVGTVLRNMAPQTRIIAVVAENAAAMKLSLESGQPVSTASADTIADGIATRVPIPGSIEVLRTCCDDVVAVSETAMLDAMRLAHRALGTVLEPSGAAGIAYLLSNPHAFRGQRVVTILSGANISDELRAQLQLPK